MSDDLVPAYEFAMNGVKLAPDVTSCVNSVEVTHEPNSLDHFTLTVANAPSDLRFTHGDLSNVFREGNAVTIKLGYVNALQKIFEGEVTRVTANFPSASIPTLTVEGHSLLHRLRGSTSTRTFQKVTDSDIATKIAGAYGLSAQVDKTSTKHEYVLQAAQNDFDFLIERAKRIRYELLADGRTLIFRKPSDGGVEAATLIWGSPQHAVGSKTTFVLHEFQVTLDAMAPVGTVTVRGMDPLSRELIEGQGKGGDEVDTSATTAAAIAEQAFARKTQATVFDIPVSTQAEAEEIAKALFNYHSLRLVTGSGKCSGAPAVRAGTVVKLDGLGPRFNGGYYVAQSTHRYSEDGYETRFEVRRGVAG